MGKRDRKPGEEAEIETSEQAEEVVAQEFTADVPEPESKSDEAEAAGLVKMRKGDEVLHVHPTTVDAHLKADWQIV